MAEFTIPPAFEPLVEACGEAALPAFEGADFANDPGAAFSATTAAAASSRAGGAGGGDADRGQA